MSLLLTVYNTPDWKTLVTAAQLKVLTQTPTAPHKEAAILEPVQTFSQLNNLLSLLSGTDTLWIATVQAELYLANALERGSSLTEASIEWEQKTNELLAFHTQNRRTIKLVNLHHALAQPDVFCNSLADTIPCKPFTPRGINNNVELLAACQYVAQNTTIKLLNTRLHASAVTLSENELLNLNINQILDNARQSNKEFESTLKTLESIKKERDLVLGELQKVQEQLEEYYLKLQVEQQNSMRTLLARDKQHAREIAKFDLELHKAKAKAANIEFAGQQQQLELNRLKQSLAWKAAKPVRMFGNLVRKTDISDSQLNKEITLLLSSDFFDAKWYLHTYNDVAEQQINPAEHYLIHGAKEGRLPSPIFDGNWYLEQYPDVAKAGDNPLMHFILFGQHEGRSSSPKSLADNSVTTEGSSTDE